jgi:hypothetical protein
MIQTKLFGPGLPELDEETLNREASVG